MRRFARRVGLATTGGERRHRATVAGWRVVAQVPRQSPPRHRHQQHDGGTGRGSANRALDILTSSRTRRHPALFEGTADRPKRYGQGEPKKTTAKFGVPRNLERFLLGPPTGSSRGPASVTLNFRPLGFPQQQFQRGKERALAVVRSGALAYGSRILLTRPGWRRGGGGLGREPPTPQTNKDTRRDHWAQVGSRLIAGALPHQQVVGATDRLGTEIADRRDSARFTPHYLPWASTRK